MAHYSKLMAVGVTGGGPQVVDESSRGAVGGGVCISHRVAMLSRGNALTGVATVMQQSCNGEKIDPGTAYALLLLCS